MTGNSSTQRNPGLALVLFFVLALNISWLLLLPHGLARTDVLPPVIQLLGFLSKYGPSIAGVLITVWAFGRAGGADLRRRTLLWRVGMNWWLGCLLGPVLLLALARWINIAMDGREFVANWAMVWVFLPRLLTHGFFGGGLGEELGWRGFALPVLQQRIGALWASVIIGLVWAGWHAPQLVLDPSPARNARFLPFCIAVVLASIVMTWIYNQTGGSVLLCIVFHASVNAAPRMPGPQGAWVICALLVPVALYPLLRHGPRTLSARPIRPGALDVYAS